MGYAWNGVCYQDTASALNAFVRDTVAINPTGINTFTATPTISGAGLVTWSISNRPLTGTTATTRNGTTQLPSCTTENMGQWEPNAVMFIVALFFAFAHGYKTGFRA